MKEKILFNSRYSINENQEIRNIETGRILKTSKRGKYLYVGLRINGVQKTFTVHQLMAIAFLGHIPCGMDSIIDHIDDTPNNMESNLQIINNRENCSKDKRGFSSKYTGVWWSKRHNNWKAFIRINGEKKYLGSFKDEYEAHTAYQKALKEINNLCTQ